MHTAVYLTRKYSVGDGLAKDPTFNIENPVAIRSLLESMNNKEDIITHGQVFKNFDVQEFKKTQRIQKGSGTRITIPS